jgi:hypothetical protein
MQDSKEVIKKRNSKRVKNRGISTVAIIGAGIVTSCTGNKLRVHDNGFVLFS